jgi:hypothetical protein
MRSNQLAPVGLPKCPKMQFHANSNEESLRSHFTAYQRWLDQPSISPSKKVILGNIVRYVSSIYNSFLTKMSTHPSRYKICSDILGLGDLPDILLMQYIMNELSKIRDQNSNLRDPNLQIARTYMNLLLKPYLKETKKIGAGLIACAFVAIASGVSPKSLSIFLLIIGSLAVTCDRPITEYRIQKALQDRLDDRAARALNINITAALPLEDEFEPAINALADVAAAGTRIFYGFFHQQRARIEGMAEAYDPPRYDNSQRRLD